MKYFLSYKEFIIKSDNNIFVKDNNGRAVKANIMLTNRNLMVNFTISDDDGDEEEALRIFPIEYINLLNGSAQINTGGGNQPYFEVYFPDQSLYVFFGHSIKRNWQIQAEGRVQQWVTAINNAVANYKSTNGITNPVYSTVHNQFANPYTNQTGYSSPVIQTQRPKFCPGCGSPVSPDDIFCVACGTKV